MYDHWTKVLEEIDGSPADLGTDILGINAECRRLGKVQAVFLKSHIIFQGHPLFLLLVVLVWDIGELDSVRIGDTVLLGIGLNDGRETRVWGGITIDLLELLRKRSNNKVHHSVLIVICLEVCVDETMVQR